MTEIHIDYMVNMCDNQTEYHHATATVFVDLPILQKDIEKLIQDRESGHAKEFRFRERPSKCVS